MSHREYPSKPCHNCRRRRLKCDRSYPQCHKCIRTAQECLGYGEILRWNKGVASRGKMMGLAFGEGKQGEGNQVISSTKKRTALSMLDISSTASHSPRLIACGLCRISGEGVQLPKHPSEQTPRYTLIDPLFQDLNRDLRCFLDYFARQVCKDLVCYDIPDDNPFRGLIPLSKGYPALFHVIIAISALHMSNACRGSVDEAPSNLPQLQSASDDATLRTTFSSTRSSKAYEQALVAKQTALRFLRQALNNTQSGDLEIALASVLLFIEFELIHSGRGDWKPHINGAKVLIDTLQSSHLFRQGHVSQMCSCLISNCAVYDILGSTLVSSIPYKSPHTSPAQLLSALKTAEANNYLSCPAILLQLVLTATELSHSVSRTFMMSPTRMASTSGQQISLLLLTARSFDAVVWATDLQKFSPHKDAQKRLHIASAHKAAVCIYITRAASLFSQALDHGDELESLVSDVIHHLSFIACDDGLFKATSWPTFIAGAETKELAHQEWAVKRLYKLWDFCPWGYIQSAVEMLNKIWGTRNSVTNGSGVTSNWVQELRSLGVDWLIA